MTRFVTSIMMAVWISSIAVLAIQNATPVTLQLLTVRSVAIPLGLVMAFSASIGMVGTALVLGLLRPGRGA